MGTRYKHIGYFNNIADIVYLRKKTADEVIDYWKQGLGEFHKKDVHELDTDFVIPNSPNFRLIGDYQKQTADKQYIVIDDTFDMEENQLDVHTTNKEDFFIDIYEKYEEEGVTFEECPYCGEEVKLEAELKVQVCPSCGKHIVTCSMCLNEDWGAKCSRHCCLEIVARTLNGEKGFENPNEEV